MSKLRLEAALAQEGFSVTFGPEAIAVQLDGGKSRQRRVQLGAAALVNAQWFCTAHEYDYLLAFYRARAAHGSQPFTLDMILDEAPIAEYTAQFVPGTLSLTEIRGTVYIAGAQLEVIPLPENQTADLALVLYREAEVAQPGPLTLNVTSAALAVSGNSITSNPPQAWHIFYSTEFAADSVVASWRQPSSSVAAVAGLIPFIPAADGDPNGYTPGGKVLYVLDSSNNVSYLPPGLGFNQIAVGLHAGDLYTVIIKDGVVYYYRAIGDSVEFLASSAAAAGNYRFGGQILRSKISDIKLAVF